MAHLLFHFATLLILTLPVWSQDSVQDAWTAPSVPDDATTLRHGSQFTILWKTTLQDTFAGYCTLCDPRKVDLWVTSFNGKGYRNKIGRNVNVTRETSFPWVVSIETPSTTDVDSFVFRFTYTDSQDPFTDQISSPGFKISGLPRASSSISFSRTTSSSLASPIPSSESTSASSTPTTSTSPPLSTAADTSTSKDNSWIAGVVIGPLAGIALGAAVMWFLLRKRKNNQRQHEQQNIDEHTGGYDGGYGQTYSAPQHYPDKYTHTGMQPVEAPGANDRAELGDHR